MATGSPAVSARLASRHLDNTAARDIPKDLRRNNLNELRPRVARPEQDAKGVRSGLHALRVLLRACHPRSQLVQVILARTQSQLFDYLGP
jgi:hypothetical protein